ncbi:MAG: hypothetical protein QOH71_4598 [Blastocatellia bacterium]|jgi:hypothetical protein|nr:hypothetical protein [Blastocatellia bacterium]
MPSVISTILAKIEAGKDLPDEFENLLPGTYEIKSEWTGVYNCIAFAANETHRKWWPVPFDEGRKDRYWPEGAPRTEKLKSFVRAFEICGGYRPCDDDQLENGIEKVAIFMRGSKPTHMARQLLDGKWVSKLGDKQDIHHNSLHEVEGRIYGTVVRILCRDVVSAT